MTRPAITVENLSKAYRIGVQTERADSFVGALQNAAAAPFRNWNSLRKLNTYGNHADAEDLHWALRDVSFEVPEGEVLGVIGRNGAGKSTLLKILSRITEPTRGRATIRGRVSSLLEVGTGFHPELSGRENIYLNGTILGMRKREIDRKLDQIIDFSGVEKFLDTPIKRYSSGMKVRLAFAVAAHLEPEILIIDEVLAVGDVEFQKKCLGKMHDVASGGRTVLFVSHNMDALSSLCSTGVVLEGGRLSYMGNMDGAVELYHQRSQRISNCAVASLPRKISNVRQPAVVGFSINGDESGSACIKCGAPVHFAVELANLQDRERLLVSVVICTSGGHRVVFFNSAYHSNLWFDGGDSLLINCSVDSLSLVPGSYRVDVGVGERDMEIIEYVEEVADLEVVYADALGTGRLPDQMQGHFVVPSSWSLQ